MPLDAPAPPTRSMAAAVSQLPPHTLTIFERDPAKPLVTGLNPVQIATLSVPHQVTIPRRETAALKLVLDHCKRIPTEINHVPGGHLTAIVTKG